ncbi:MAG: sulfatase [Planctomycetes bacterium]|nr:sulfatase [Planctomycetota bacterium]
MRSRATHSTALAVLVLLAAGSAPRSQSAATAHRPNVLFLYTDDHAADALSAYRPGLIETPNLDRIARDGALFRNAFCGNSICGPARATVLTGLHSHANGFCRNGDRFDGSQTTFPKLLRAAGYATAVIGKWHLGSEPTGFDHWEVLPGQGQYYNPDFDTPAGRVRFEGHSTEVVTERALRWLREGRPSDRPFVLMCQFKAPHRPWLPGPRELQLLADADIPLPPTLFDDWSGRGPASREQEMTVARHLFLAYDLQCPVDEDEELFGAYTAALRRMTPAQRATWDRAFEAENAAFRADPPTGRALVEWKCRRYLRNYLRCVLGVDRAVGRLLDALDELGIADDTLVVYSSDQGFYLGDHGWYDKRWMYEESLRVPLLMRWPGHLAPGTTIDALVQNIDFAPTFVDLAGLPVQDAMHGTSLVPLFDGVAPVWWRTSIWYRYYDGIPVHAVPGHRGVRTATHKLMVFDRPELGTELYDLRADPDELHSIADSEEAAGIRRDLEAELRRQGQRYGDRE